MAAPCCSLLLYVCLPAMGMGVQLAALLASLLAYCAQAASNEFSGCDGTSSSLISGILKYRTTQEHEWSARQVDHVVSCVVANDAEAAGEDWIIHPLFDGLRIRPNVSGDAVMALSLLLTFQPRIPPPRILEPHSSSSRGRCAFSEHVYVLSLSLRYLEYIMTCLEPLLAHCS